MRRGAPFIADCAVVTQNASGLVQRPSSRSIRSGNLQAMLWMVLSAACIVTMSGVLKHLTRELPVMVVLFFRMLFALPLVLPWLAHSGLSVLRTSRLSAHLLRGAVGAVSMWCWVFAVSGLALADFTAISFTRPLWMPLTAWLVLGELVGFRRAGLIVLGFTGVLMVVRPNFHVDAAVLVALVGGALSSLTLVQVKQLTTTEPPVRIVFYFSIFGTLFATPFAALNWVLPTPVQLAWLAAVAIAAAFGQYCIARACESGETTVITPVDFLQLPFAAAVGFVVFGERPDLWIFAGTILILLATLGIARQTQNPSARPEMRA